MFINNYSNNTSFGGIKVKSTKMLEKEGLDAISKLEDIKDNFSSYKWHLNINPDNYSLTSPTTKKTYNGPFSVKRHVIKKNNEPDVYSVIVRMSDSGKERYSILFESQEEAFKAYKEIKKSKGIAKMVKLLEILERGFNIKRLRNKISDMHRFAALRNIND